MIYQVLEYYIKNYETIIHLPLGRVKAKKGNFFIALSENCTFMTVVKTSANRHK